MKLAQGKRNAEKRRDVSLFLEERRRVDFGRNVVRQNELQSSQRQKLKSAMLPKQRVCVCPASGGRDA
jgi:hypothetical protein